MGKAGLVLALAACAVGSAVAPATAKPLLPVIKQLPGGTLPSPTAPVTAACPQQRCELPPVHGFVVECSRREGPALGGTARRDGCSVTSHDQGVDCSTVDYDFGYMAVRQVGCNARVVVDRDVYLGSGCSHAGIRTDYETLGCDVGVVGYYESPDGASVAGIPIPLP